MRGLLAILLLLAACPGGGSGADAGPRADAGPVSDATADAARLVNCDGLLDGGTHSLALVDGKCVTCLDFLSGWDQTHDGECGDFADGCRAYCQYGHCRRRCDGVCPASPDAGACVVGAGTWRSPVADWQRWICEPTCGATGGCRSCLFDDECVAEYGAGVMCARHCGTCCGGDAGVCDCI